MASMPGGTVVTRFAPSPNGRLHAGHALSAIVGHAFARHHGGRFLLRIEDIDTDRSRTELVEWIIDDLAWLGLDWERPVLRQSEHWPVYSAAAQRLETLGVLYPCFATRGEIRAAVPLDAALDPDGAPRHPGRGRVISDADARRRRDRGEPFALRLDMAAAARLVAARLDGRPLTFTSIDAVGAIETRPAEPARWGDVVLVRKDVPTSYHLSVVVDDARQGVTHVTRGLDLLAATDLHRMLQVLLELPEPVYHHHRLVTDPSGRKLSKSAGDLSLASLRATGTSPAELRAMLGCDDDASA